jgi:type II secretory pathway pseudopilin PulG
MMKRMTAGDTGLSLMELTVMLSVLSVLTATMAPSVVDYVGDARRVKASGDVQVVAVGVAQFLLDGNDTAAGGAGWRECSLLVGAGATPGSRVGAEGWTSPLEPGGACAIDDHLVTNRPGYAAMSNATGSWLRQGWSGPYVGSVGPDPWGHRYAVNSRHLADGSLADTIVLSAGPDGVIDTPFDVDGVAPAGDDLIAVISAGR